MVVIEDVEGSRKALKDCADATDVLCRFQVGGLDHEKVMASIDLFTHKVADLPTTAAADT